jgi:uncharacterized surface protein with fasciclin (FAS1) repeats
MFSVSRLTLPLLLLGACGEPAAPEAAPPAAASLSSAVPRPKPDANKPADQLTVADIAVGSPDHTTLVTALAAAGLVDALASPGGVYTVFAPTDAAFAKLPAGTVEGLLAPEKKDALTKILRHHATVPILMPADLKDGTELSMSDGTKVTLHVQGDQIRIDDANVVATVKGMNGVVYVIDGVLLPK